MQIKYFDQTTWERTGEDDRWRIAVVAGCLDTIYDDYNPEDEISLKWLPASFNNWQEYDRGAGIDYTVTVYSPDGD